MELHHVRRKLSSTWLQITIIFIETKRTKVMVNTNTLRIILFFSLLISITAFRSTIDADQEQTTSDKRKYNNTWSWKSETLDECQ